MTTVAQPPPRHAGSRVTSPARQLQKSFAAARVSFTWLGVRKALTAEQKAQAAEGFGAEGTYISAAKKLLDTRHPSFRAVTAVRSRILHYWKGVSLPYPDPGVRLIRQDAIAAFDEQLTECRSELDAAVEALDEQLDALKVNACDRLGRLYSAEDYPKSFRGLFAVDWDYPSVEPPEYLLRLNPDLYEQERERMAARFDQAVKLAEEAFAAEFAKLTSHLVERLTASPGGDRKVFRDSAVTNLREFFERFRGLNVRSNADLDRLVETAHSALEGVDPDAVRGSAALREHITSQLTSVQSALDGMLVDQPRRRILRLSPGKTPGRDKGMIMHIVIAPNGNARCVYGEAIDLGQLGSTEVRRASFVEPDARGRWFADLSPVGGHSLGPFARRSDALDAEVRWLNEQWLTAPA